MVGTLQPNDVGVAYVYQRAGDSWEQTAKLGASDGARGDLFGASVAIDGDTILVGAPDAKVGKNADQGAVYSFSRTGTAARTETAKLTVSNGAPFDELGASVAIDGDTIVAGAPGAAVGGVAKGAVYTFTRSGARARTETGTLSASDGSDKALLGYSVAIDADTILAGAPTETVGHNLHQGSVYAFSRTGPAARRQTRELSDSDGAANDLFGLSVALDAGATVVGAPMRGEV